MTYNVFGGTLSLTQSINQASACESVSLIFTFASPDHMQLVTINHFQVHTTLMTSRRSLGQRSRSGSDGGSSLVNSVTPGQLSIFEPKLTQVLPSVGSQTG